jgi:elongation factor P
MLNVTDLRAGAAFRDQSGLWEVQSYQHIKMGRGSANIKIRARNLRTGAIVEKSFISGARVEEVEVEKKKAQFLYADQSNANFMDQASFEQFSLPASLVASQIKFLKEGESYDLAFADSEILGVELPRNMILKIAETGPGIKGDTVSTAYKAAKLENGLEVKVPLFLKEGDAVKIDTRSGEYLERAKAA